MCGHRAGMSALKCGFPASSRRATRTQKAIPALALAARMRVGRATSLTMRWMVSYMFMSVVFAHLRTQAPELLQPDEDNEDGEAVSVALRTKETDIYALGMASRFNTSISVLKLTLVLSDYAGRFSERMQSN